MWPISREFGGSARKFLIMARRSQPEHRSLAGPRNSELAELLAFLSQWLARDPARLGASLEDFVGHPAYNTGNLCADLHRFVFLLGGNDGEELFGEPAQ